MSSTGSKSRWTLDSTGNRIMYSAVAGLVVFAVSRNVVAWAVASVAVYAVLTLTAIASRRR